jgi:hypothetical protein
MEVTMAHHVEDARDMEASGVPVLRAEPLPLHHGAVQPAAASGIVIIGQSQQQQSELAAAAADGWVDWVVARPALLASGRWREPSFSEQNCCVGDLIGCTVFVDKKGTGILRDKIAHMVGSNGAWVAFTPSSRQPGLGAEINLRRKGNNGVPWLIRHTDNIDGAGRRSQELLALRKEYFRLAGWNGVDHVPESVTDPVRAEAWLVSQISQMRRKRSKCCSSVVGVDVDGLLVLAVAGAVGYGAVAAVDSVQALVQRELCERDELKLAAHSRPHDDECHRDMTVTPLPTACAVATPADPVDCKCPGQISAPIIENAPAAATIADFEEEEARQTLAGPREQWRGDNPGLAEDYEAWLPHRTTAGAAMLRSAVR